MSRESILFKGIDLPIDGEIWECGVFRGENAAIMNEYISGKGFTLRLFDTFSGQPFSGPNDVHKVGSMNGTSYEYVSQLFSECNNVIIHQGIMPDTFSGLENKTIKMVNIDVDNYDSVKSCLEFIYPRVPSGGYIILDDYGCPDCPGARLATDEFLKDKPEKLLNGGSASQVFFIKE